jgi:hypothetical protein
MWDRSVGGRDCSVGDRDRSVGGRDRSVHLFIRLNNGCEKCARGIQVRVKRPISGARVGSSFAEKVSGSSHQTSHLSHIQYLSPS